MERGAKAEEKDIFWEFQELIKPSLVTLVVSALIGCEAEMLVQGCLVPAAPTDLPFPVMAVVALLAILTARRISHFPQPHKVN